MATWDEQNAILELQREYFANDDHIRSEVAIWADSTPEERLAEVAAMTRASAVLLERLDEAQLASLWRTRQLPADTIAILERL
ncbi:MAG: hypothetical protein ABI591_17640 [Kofleriaceae bacterium]